MSVPLITTFNVVDDNLANGETTKLVIVFDQPITGLEISDFRARGVTLENLVTNDNGVTWTANVIPNDAYNGRAGIVLESASYVSVDNGTPGEGTSVFFKVDTTGPRVRLTVDDITVDDIVNIDEANEQVAVNGKIIGEFTKGDEVTLTVNGKEYKGEVDELGIYSILVAGSDLVADTDKVIDAKTVSTDAAGNIDTFYATHRYDVDISAPAAPTISFESTGADDVYNDQELGKDGTITVQVEVPEGTQIGDMLMVNDTEMMVTQEIIDNGMTMEMLPEDKVVARITDIAGNKGAEATKIVPKYDGTTPGEENTTLIIDPVTSDNTINYAESQGTVTLTGLVTGEFSPGDQVTITINKTNYTTEVAADGSFSVEVSGSELANDGDQRIAASVLATSANGNQGYVSNFRNYNVDTEATAAPVISFEPTGDDDVYNSEELGEDGTVEATITVPEGTQVGDTLTINGIDYPVTQDIIDNGQVIDVAPEDTVTATVTDAAGNISPEGAGTAPAADTTGPASPENGGSTELIIDPVTEDNTVNAAEANVPVTITGQATGEFSEGDMVTLSVNGKDYTGSVDADGNFSIDVDGSDLAADTDATIDAILVATDAAGNTGNIEAKQNYNIDTEATAAPAISFEPTGDDDVYNSDELGEDGTVEATISVPEGTQVGDTLTINGIDYPVTQDIIDNGQVIDVAPEDTVTATVTDAAGNTSPEATAEAPAADTTGPATPENGGSTELIIDPVTEDNTVNAAEANAPVSITGQATGEFSEGDSVTLSVNGKDYTGSVDADGNFSIDVDGSDLAADPDATIDAILVATDAAGNTGNIEAKQNYNIDTEATAAPAISFEPTGDDDVYNSDELGEDGTVEATISVPEGTQVGDTLTINGIDYPVTQDIIDNGQVIDVAPEDTVTATVTDAAGNTSPEAVGTAPAADTTGPATPENGGSTELIIDPVTEDNTVNAAEANAPVSITGQATGEFSEGDMVTLSVNGKDYTGSVDADGNFSIDVDGSDLAADPDATIDAILVATDAAGNTGNIEAKQNYNVDTEATAAPVVTIVEDKNNDGFINAAELEGQADYTVFMPETAEEGDTLVVNGQTIAITSAILTNGYNASVMVTDGEQVQIEAFIQDKAGNISPVASDSAIVDLVVPEAGELDAPDATFDTTPTITGSGAEAGASVSISLYDTEGQLLQTLDSVTVAEDGTYSATPVTSLPIDEFTAVATVTDKAGNISIVEDKGSIQADANPIFLDHLGYNLTHTEGPYHQGGKVGSEMNYLTTSINDHIYIGYKGFDAQGNLIVSCNDGDFERDYGDPNVVWEMNTGKGNDFIQLREDQNAYTVAKLGSGDDTYYIGGKLDADLVAAQYDANARSYVFAEDGDDTIVVGGNGDGCVTGWGVDGGRIFTGAGSDNVVVYGEMDDGGVIDLGSGDTTYSNGDDPIGVINNVKGGSSETASDSADAVNNLHITKNLGEAGRYDYGIVQGTIGRDNIVIGTCINGYSQVLLGDNQDTLEAQHATGHSNIDMGSGDDSVDITGSIWQHAEFLLGEGDDRMTVGHSLNGHSRISSEEGSDSLMVDRNINHYSLVEMGAGNDNLVVKHSIQHRSTVAMDEGADSIHVGGNVQDHAVLNTNSGDDLVVVEGMLAGHATVHLGVGDNTLEAHRGIHGAVSVTADDGDDVVASGEDIDGYSHINLGHGNNVIIVAEDVEDKARLSTGNGDDIIIVDRYIENYSVVSMGAGDDQLSAEGINNAAKVDMGSGNDTVTINTQFGVGHGAAHVMMGEGDDQVIFAGQRLDGMIDGDAGDDTLVLTFNDSDVLTSSWQHVTNLSSQNFNGFEHIDLQGKNVVDIRYHDIVNDTERDGALFITGDENSKVDLGANNWNSDGADKANLQDGYWGSWNESGSATVDGVTYDIYQHSSAGNDMSNAVYIQQNIVVI